jgi:magnesium-transporting ATPase (P-type)
MYVQWPFSKATKRSGALLSNDNGTGSFYASGAAKSILDRCAHLLLPDGKVIEMSGTQFTCFTGTKVPILTQIYAHIAGQRMALNHVLFNLSNISLNGVALAYRLISKPHVFGLNCSQSLCADAEGPQLDSWLGNLEEHQQLLATDMVFVGLLAFKNELGQDVPRAAALSKEVGVKMRIVTGEAMEAGKAAALACGLLPDGAIALNSSEWNAMTQGEQGAQFTCFTGTKVQILTLRTHI